MPISKSSSAPDLYSFPLERPTSVRRLLPGSSENWLTDEYWIGPENQLVRYLLTRDGPLNLAAISPLVLYGPKSVGKTALAITLAVLWSRQLQEKPICFMTGQNLTQEYIAASEINDFNAFRKRLRGARLLVLDDYDSLHDKPSVQAELSATLDSLLLAQRPVIVTSRCLPAALSGFDGKLASRLSAGLSVPLAPPGECARQAIMESLVAKQDQDITVAAIAALARDLSRHQILSATDIGHLVRLSKLYRLDNGSLDRDKILAMMRQSSSLDTPSLPVIVKSVCRRTRIKLRDMRGPSRQANIVRARGLAIVLARHYTSLSLMQIGNYLGGRDHSTILHAYTKTTSLLDIDRELASIYGSILADILA
ncbi:MAG: ATP-binding protein [Pirellulaceae bacterium]|nr:ATP-binding protein [Pirellulaceae bacterium]